MRSIIRQAEAICRSAGTSLRNAVRIQQFHTDLADLPAAIEVWDEAMEHAPLPLSPIEVPGCRSPARGCRSIFGSMCRHDQSRLDIAV